MKLLIKLYDLIWKYVMQWLIRHFFLLFKLSFMVFLSISTIFRHLMYIFTIINSNSQSIGTYSDILVGLNF